MVTHGIIERKGIYKGGVSAMAGRNRKYNVKLSNEERNRLKEAIRNKKSSNTIRNRCRILLALDENQSSTTTYDDCAYYLGVSKPMISNVVKCYPKITSVLSAL